MGITSSVACLAMIALFGAACSTLPEPPPIAVRSDWGVARAETDAAARRLSEHLAAVGPAMRARVPGLTPRAVDARFVVAMPDAPRFAKDAGIPWELHGRSLWAGDVRWIELWELADPIAERRVLVHELVHDGLGPDWDPLPHFLEEGLCDDVRDSVVPEGSTTENLERVLLLATVLRRGLVTAEDGAPLGFGQSVLLAHPRATLTMRLIDVPAAPAVSGALTIPAGGAAFNGDAVTYAVMAEVGYLLASRIGPVRLHALCLRAKERRAKILPPEWVLEAAGLPPDPSDAAWERAVLELYGPLEQRLHVAKDARPKRR